MTLPEQSSGPPAAGHGVTPVGFPKWEVCLDLWCCDHERPLLNNGDGGPETTAPFGSESGAQMAAAGDKLRTGTTAAEPDLLARKAVARGTTAALSRVGITLDACSGPAPSVSEELLRATLCFARRAVKAARRRGMGCTGAPLPRDSPAVPALEASALGALADVLEVGVGRSADSPRQLSLLAAACAALRRWAQARLLRACGETSSSGSVNITTTSSGSSQLEAPEGAAAAGEQGAPGPAKTEDGLVEVLQYYAGAAALFSGSGAQARHSVRQPASHAVPSGSLELWFVVRSVCW
jgi:hypothetical protein